MTGPVEEPAEGHAGPPSKKKTHNHRQLSAIAACATYSLARRWFAGRFSGDAEPYMVRLLLGIFLSYESGGLPTKKQAMTYMNATDGRTSQRYLALAKKEGLLRVVRSKVDKRIDLLCPTDALLSLVKDELIKIDVELRLATKLIESFSETLAPMSRHPGLSDAYSFLAQQARPLLPDSNEPGNSAVSLKQAITRYNEIIKLAPKSYAAWRERGNSYMNLATISFDFDRDAATKAIRDYTEAIRLSPSEPDLYFLRGNALFRLQDYHRALVDFDELIRLQPKGGLAHIYRSRIHRALGDDERASLDSDVGSKLEAARRAQLNSEADNEDSGPVF
jgi:tetratricopeptide (TPR) repeat protein